MPIGGGGLISGVGSYFKQMSPHTKIIGVEPAGAPSMERSLKAGKVIELDDIDKFVDGAAVKRVGDLTFNITQKVIDDIVLVPEGKICTKILDRITSYNVCYTKLLRLFAQMLVSLQPAVCRMLPVWSVAQRLHLAPLFLAFEFDR